MGEFFVHSGQPGWVPAAAIARQGPGAREGEEDDEALVRAVPHGRGMDPLRARVVPPRSPIEGKTARRRDADRTTCIAIAFDDVEMEE